MSSTPDSQEILYQTKPVMRRAYFFALVFAGLVLYGRIATDLDPQYNGFWIACFWILVIALAIAFLRHWTTNYYITKDEIQSYSGVLARHVVIVPLSRVSNATVDQSILERLLGMADLTVDAPGGGPQDIVFSRITFFAANEAARIVRQLRGEATAAVMAREAASHAAQNSA